MDRTKLLCCMHAVPGALMVALALFLSLPGSMASAHELSVQECREGADYIRNAALSREHGMSESAFMDIFDNDLAMIMAIPKELRWFVQDDEDAAFLRSALNQVFRQPKAPSEHAMDFAHACVARAGKWDLKGGQEI